MPEAAQKKGKVVTLASALMNRLRWGTLAGITYEGDRDTYKTLGYRKSLNWEHYYDRYDRDGIASRIVDAPVNATWRRPPSIIEGDKPDEDNEFEKAWLELQERLKIFPRLERVDKLSSLGDFSILYIGLRGQDPTRPIRSVDSPEDVMYLAPIGRRKADIGDFIKDPRDERFALPENYKVNFGKDQIGLAGKNEIIVHHSRIIHVAIDVLDNDIIGYPRLRKVWNYLDDLHKVTGGSSEAVWRTADRGIQFDVDKDMQFDPNSAAADDLSDEIEDYMHGMRRYIRTKGISMNVLDSDVPNPKGAFDSIISLISGATGIPQRILLGSERGQLASTQDRASWNERVSERQTSFAEPCILRPLVDKLINIKALPEIEYKVKWPDLMAMTESERSLVAQQIGSAVSRVVSQWPGSPVTIITPEEFRTRWLGLPENMEGEDPSDEAKRLAEEARNAEKERTSEPEGGTEGSGSGDPDGSA